MEGLNCLGVDGEIAIGFDYVNFFKAEGPKLITDAGDAMNKKDDKGKADAKKDDKGDKPKSWLTRPVLGPVPGYGVLALGAGVLGAAGYAVKRIFF